MMLGLALTMTAGMMMAAMLGSSALMIWQMLLPAASLHMLACMWTTHRCATQTTHESSLRHASRCETPSTLSAQVPLHSIETPMKAITVWHKGNIGGKCWEVLSLCIRRAVTGSATAAAEEVQAWLPWPAV